MKALAKEVKLKTVATPFLPEDHSDAPARVPRSGESAVCCPWCQHSFPESEFKGLRSKSNNNKKKPSSWRGGAEAREAPDDRCVYFDENFIRCPEGEV